MYLARWMHLALGDVIIFPWNVIPVEMTYRMVHYRHYVLAPIVISCAVWGEEFAKHSVWQLKCSGSHQKGVSQG